MSNLDSLKEVAALTDTPDLSPDCLEQIRRDFGQVVQWIDQLDDPARQTCLRGAIQRYSDEGLRRLKGEGGYYADSALPEQLLQQGVIRPGERIIDLGTGPGDTIEMLARQGVAVQGVELIPSYAARFYKDNPGQQGRFRLGVIDSPFDVLQRQTELPESSADLTTGFLIMDRLSEPRQALRNAVRLTQVGGRIVFGCLLPNLAEDTKGQVYTPPERRLLSGRSIEDDCRIMRATLEAMAGTRDVSVQRVTYTARSTKDGPEVFENFFLFSANNILSNP